MAKTVVATFKLKNGTLQGSSINPQKTVNPQKKTVNPQKTVSPQPVTYNPQAYYSPAVSGLSLAARQASAARALAIRRQAEARKRLLVRQAKARKKLLTVRKRTERERFAEWQMLNRKILAKKSFADQVKLYFSLSAAARSRDRVKNKNLADELTGGFTAETAAHQWAQNKQGDLQPDITGYEDRVKKHNKKLADYNARIKHLAVHGTQQQYEAAVAGAKSWLAGSIDELQWEYGRIAGSAEGYGKYMNSALKSPLAGVFKYLDPKNNVITRGMEQLWKYTLGTGDEKIPSIVTAGSRLVTAATNVGRKKGDVIYDKEGKPFKYSGDPWGASHKQAILNAHAEMLDFNSWAKNRYLQLTAKAKTGEDALYLNQADASFDPKAFEAWRQKNAKTLQKRWKKDVERTAAQVGFAAEIALDPLSYSPSVVIKAPKFVGVLKTTELAQKLAKSRAGRTVAWLNKEHVTPKQDFYQKSVQYAKDQKVLQSHYWQKFVTLRKKIQGNQFDYSVIDDLGKLTDEEAAILQRMTGLDTFALRDRAAVAGARSAEKRAFLLHLHKRAQRNAALLKKIDKVQSDRFVDTYYSKGWRPLGKSGRYDFRSLRRSDNTLTASDLKVAQVERYMLSSLDDIGNAPSDAARTQVTQAQKELKTLLADYKAASAGSREELEAAYKKLNSHSQRLLRVLGLPMSTWRAAVLALRPAWYVNNAAYNTVAGLNAAGLDYLPEAAKFLKRGKLKAARKANPRVIGKLDKYVDTRGNKLWKGASAIEDSNRLAAYNVLRGRGLTHEEAMKRVDKYFFKYDTKNYERPLKAVMPFWAWTKSTAGLAPRLPFENPRTAKVLAENDENNQRQVKKLPSKMRPYYAGRQYLGTDKEGNPIFMNAPYNPFSAGQFSNVSMNPFLAALGELSRQRDQYGNELKDKDIFAVFAEKFPQAHLARKAFNAYKQANGDIDTAVKYFGDIGSEGYATTKVRQGSDPSAGNYNSKLDNGAGLKDDILAYLGIPKSSKFNRATFEESERLTELNKKFFDINWKVKYKDYNKRVAAQEALAHEYGFDLTKDLYKGLWAKNDTKFTRELKAQKEAARKYLSDFWDEYTKQPYGSRSIWVKNKMAEIVDSGILAKNQFISDGLPDWYDPKARDKANRAEFWQTYFASDVATRKKLLQSTNYQSFNFSYQSSQKKIDYLAAKSSGDWTLFNQRYGYSSDKQRAYYAARKSGNWDEYTKKYGSTRRRAAAAFWKKYFASDNATKKRLLAENPKYDKYKDDTPKTQAEWDVILENLRNERKARALRDRRYVRYYRARMAEGVLANTVANRRASRNTKKLVWK